MTHLHINTSQAETRTQSRNTTGLGSQTVDCPGLQTANWYRKILDRFNGNRIQAGGNSRHEVRVIKYFKHADKARFFEFQFHINDGEENECAFL